MKIDGAVMGVLAIVAGILVLWGYIDIKLVIGIYLIVIGIVALLRR